MAFSKSVTLIIIVFSLTMIYMPMLFFKIYRHIGPLAIYVVSMTIYTIAEILLSIYVWRTKKKVTQTRGLENTVKLKKFNELMMMILPLLLAVVIIYEIFINISYCEFLGHYKDMPKFLEIMIWPVLRILYVLYELVHGIVFLKLLDTTKYKVDTKDQTKLALVVMFSIDIITWVIGVINLSSGSTESWADKAFPNWQFSRKIFWSIILLYRLLISTVLFEMIWYNKPTKTHEIINSKHNTYSTIEEDEQPIYQEETLECSTSGSELSTEYPVLPMVYKWLDRVELRIIAFGVGILGFAVIISSYNPNEKYVNEFVKLAYFTMVDIICLISCILIIVGNKVLTNKIKFKDILKKWIHYIPNILFLLSALVFNIGYTIYYSDALYAFDDIMVLIILVIECLLLIVNTLFVAFLQFTGIKKWKNYSETYRNISSIILAYCIIQGLRVLIFEGIKENFISSYVLIMISVPLTIDFYIHSAFNFYYRYTKLV